METESEKEESVKATFGEKSGEELLTQKYINVSTSCFMPYFTFLLIQFLKFLLT